LLSLRDAKVRCFSSSSFLILLTEIAFSNCDAGDLKQLVSLKARNPNLKILIGLRANFATQPVSVLWPHELPWVDSNVTQTEGVRAQFARRLRDFLYRHELDGVDIDWEQFQQNNFILRDLSTGSGADQLSKQKTVTVQLLEQLRSEFDLQNLIVSFTVGKQASDLLDKYDFEQIAR
jgi:GH18 family chitinase